MFRNRTEAGILLADKLKNYKYNKDAIIVTIPRGGVPVGYAMATRLHLPLEIVLSKKIGHPLHKEFAIGAVTLHDRILSPDSDSILKEYLDRETKKIRDLLQWRHDTYYGSHAPISLKNKIIILVDDGVATGQSLISCIKLIEKQNPAKIIIALPVGPASVINKISNMLSINQTICLLTPFNFYAVGQYYKEFDQVDDDEVVELLKKANNQFLINS
jgi:predicted phosphoribosyltransferase